MHTIKILGTFKLTANLLRVTDPCYDKTVYCSGTIPALPGDWKAAISYKDEKYWGIRVNKLLVWHDKNGNIDMAKMASEDSGIDVGVDSGQAGFFDNDCYPDNPRDDGYEQQFYTAVSNLTLGEVQGGVIKFGTISSSGFGDGSYNCYIVKDKQGRVIAARIDYIIDHDEESEEDCSNLDSGIEEYDE